MSPTRAISERPVLLSSATSHPSMRRSCASTNRLKRYSALAPTAVKFSTKLKRFPSDQLGFAGTAGPPQTYGRAAWTKHALALLDTVGVGEVDVIGNSMGGAIALSLAAERPAAVRRIVLMGTMGVAMALPPGLDTVWGYTPSVEGMREVINLFAYNRDLITDDLVRMRYEASLDPVVGAAWAAMFPEPRQRWVDDLALSGTELAGITQPVLMVHGRDDRVVPWRSSSAPLVDLLPDCRLHVIGGCGHWTMIEKTAEFLAVVQPFLRAVPALDEL